ncbi:MAG: NAD(P)/FAD-dependent oxidoreductase [bacterium]
MNQKTAVIIGAGPAGLTAAYELLEKTDIKPVVYEMTGDIGGISKTVNYKGQRIDIGGHRFFSKSDRVMQWWQSILPLQGAPAKDDRILGRNMHLSQAGNAPAAVGAPETVDALDPEKVDRVMLIRGRVSRIFFLKKFFDYPLSLNVNTFSNLGFLPIIKIGLSYLKVQLLPIRNEQSLEDFFINRFGKELYRTFFKDYTEKVWGVPCHHIHAAWGAQRIKGLSITKSILHAVKNIVVKDDSLTQKNTETSLIGQFMYPKLGPGQMWEEVARIVKERGGECHLGHKVAGLIRQGNKIVSVEVKDETTGKTISRQGDYFFSTMPVKELIESLDGHVPEQVRQVAQGLVYRDFITVGLLLHKLKIKNKTSIKTVNDLIPDNWIYIQEREVKLGRLQIFNNWSPYMVKDENKVWVGLEYFCNEGDELWSKPDPDLARFAIEELARIDIIDKGDVLDSVVIRMPKTYPAYFGTYDRFQVIRNFVDDFDNLFLIGRNGMHRYNNQDHSMLTAMVAVENIKAGVCGKENIWAINTEEDYHEEK